MLAPRFHNRIGKVAALVAATLILHLLARGGPGPTYPPGPIGLPGHITTVPEVNAIWVLFPVVGAILFFSVRKQFPRRKG